MHVTPDVLPELFKYILHIFGETRILKYPSNITVDLKFTVCPSSLIKEFVLTVYKYTCILRCTLNDYVDKQVSQFVKNFKIRYQVISSFRQLCTNTLYTYIQTIDPSYKPHTPKSNFFITATNTSQ